MDLIFQATVIGIVQGLTEFLPVSSSAHLILVPQLLGWDDPFINSASFDVMLHLGTLLALVVYFWRDLIELIKAGIASIRERSLGTDPNRRLAWLLVISVIPAALLGVLGESFFDTYFRQSDRLIYVCGILIIGAIILFIAERVGTRARGLDQANVTDAAIIGGAQALALFPGISRSGVTIAAGLFRGLKRDSAARFAFLMGIPVIGGAGFWKARELISAPPGSADFAALAAGFIAAAIAGFLAIRFLLSFLRVHSTGIFIAWRIGFALVAAAILLTR
jgi:undecaprenyl-diphosphatase